MSGPGCRNHIAAEEFARADAITVMTGLFLEEA
jgi:hypothetical protein